MSALDTLVEALQVLPGVGPKSAQRMALQLLLKDRPAGTHLGTALVEAMQRVGHCSQCRNLSESTLCAICADASRDVSLLCVVESPADVLAFEQAGGYRGFYFVLNGRLSPLDGVGPSDLGMDQLRDRVLESDVTEIIVATNPTVEGEATAHYVVQLLSDHPAEVSRIAHGVPLGGEIEYTDGGTLAHALQGRRSLQTQ